MASHRPPRAAVALLKIVVPVGLTRDSLIGDLAEEYARRRAIGGFHANSWCWRLTAQVCAAYVGDHLRAGPAGLGRDLRFAARSLRRSPRFTAFAAVTLAVGVGATTSMFSVADALLLRPLPLHEPDALVRVHATDPARDEWRNVVAGATYLDWRANAKSFSGLAGYRSISLGLVGDDHPQRVSGVSVTSNFFDVLPVSATLGRIPRTGDEEPAERTVVLTHALWRSRFGADPDLLGTTLRLNGIPHTVVAILPAEFRFPASAELFVPSPYRVPEAPGNTEDYSGNRGAQYMSVIGRLTDGAGIATAQREMDAVAAQIAEAWPDTNRGEGARVVSLTEDLVGDARATLLVLLGAVGFVMLIACANVANLLTVRASQRDRELAVRLALGAGTGRLRRQLLVESTLLSVLGGLLGFALAAWATGTFVALAPEDVPRLAEVTVDVRVFAFSVVLALFTGLLFGLAPTIGLSDPRGGLSIHLHGSRAAESRRSRLRDVVVVTEVALSLLLLIGAGLMVRTVQGLESKDPGFDVSGTLVAHVSLPTGSYPDDTAIRSFFDDALTRVRALPGVESAGTILTLPVDWAVRGTFGFSVEGKPDDPDDPPLAGYQVVSPDLLRTMRIPVIRGRGILDTDGDGSEIVAVVNEALAERYWPGRDPLGARLTFWGDPDDPETEWARIVGIVPNVVKEGLDRPPEPEVFLAHAQVVMNRATFVVRSVGDPHALGPALRTAIREIDPTLPLYGVSSLEDVISESLAQRRFRMLLLSVFAGASLLMAAVGLYAVLSFAVARRTREIGIRRALGARSRGVILHVVTDGLRRVALGLALGVAASYALARLIESQVYGISATDGVTYLASAGILAAASLVSCWLPATRAARVDPVSAIRWD